MMSTVFLYREAGAIGAASHYARSGGYRPGFEFIGLGHLQPAGRNEITGKEWPERIAAPFKTCADMVNLDAK